MCRAAGGEEDGAVGVFSLFYVAVSFVVVFVASCCCFVFVGLVGWLVGFALIRELEAAE